jgi:hypothetical protein
MAGSKQLVNFADAMFALGKSEADEQLRYLKQLKCRSAQIKNGGDRVMLCKIVKPSNFLHFKFLHEEPEYNHLRRVSPDELTNKVRELSSEPGMSLRKIGDAVGVSHTEVSRMLKKL